MAVGGAEGVACKSSVAGGGPAPFFEPQSLKAGECLSRAEESEDVERWGPLQL